MVYQDYWFTLPIDALFLEIYTQLMEMVHIPVIYQDHYLLAVNKPAGLVIHPTYKHADGTMWDAILALLACQEQESWTPPRPPDKPEWAQAPLEVQAMLRQKMYERIDREEGLLPRPCLLHRLDKDTSGVVLLARTERSRRFLVKQFEERSIQKSYLAVVSQGAPEWTRPRTTCTVSISQNRELVPLEGSPDQVICQGCEFVIQGPLGRDPEDYRRCVVIEGGQDALTACTVLAVERGFALLNVHPITGRTHQIRAHLAAIGWAIVGDQLYATEQAKQLGLTRQFLHARSITVRHYPEKQERTFVAPLSLDLQDWLQREMPAGSRALE